MIIVLLIYFDVIFAPDINMHIFFLEISLDSTSRFWNEQSLVWIWFFARGNMQYVGFPETSHEFALGFSLVRSFGEGALRFVGS